MASLSLRRVAFAAVAVLGPAVAAACQIIDGKKANGCQCGGNDDDDDDNNVAFTNTCNSGCCYNNQCADSYHCNNAWWIATVIIVLCCVGGCGAFWWWYAENEKRKRQTYQQYVNETGSEQYAAGATAAAAPPYGAQSDGLTEGLLVSTVDVHCPNQACRLLLQFPHSACGTAVKCGVCGAQFPLANLPPGGSKIEAAATMHVGAACTMPRVTADGRSVRRPKSRQTLHAPALVVPILSVPHSHGGRLGAELPRL
eukprot:CAMPEP_0182919542 /NCGR_PEP_ID=MMETSP0105_2-20130417/2802_1 /TAXON_ID=81532 ORGANISM="Acanthoeca-like sp., Strain 10tr" /NCGR_SAMPLE_ID=MMETSP0105_2 /ASSEMBLY_ACC=CAM_ASM_000205 /LENGTH=254 /DNA_ID=CAMNT_0025056745 /DNA_START=47 /DNA_END=809 /DNA_ORIENTATION=-